MGGGHAKDLQDVQGLVGHHGMQLPQRGERQRVECGPRFGLLQRRCNGVDRAAPVAKGQVDRGKPSLEVAQLLDEVGEPRGRHRVVGVVAVDEMLQVQVARPVVRAEQGEGQVAVLHEGGQRHGIGCR